MSIAAENLPSAAEIMREALVLARRLTSGPHDFARAELLLKLARELRVGSVQRQSGGVADGVKLLDDAPAEFQRWTRVAQERREPSGYEPQSVPSEPVYADDSTQVMPAVSSCLHCRQRLSFARPSPDHKIPVWYHDLTMQTVCPGEHTPRTFAEPFSGHQ